jgi:hypothetical protein
MIPIKLIFATLFLVVLLTLLVDNKQIIYSKYNFYAFLFSITSVLVCLLNGREDIEKFVESPTVAAGDTTVGDTTVGDTTVGDTTVGDTTVGDTTVGDTTVVTGDATSQDIKFQKPNFIDNFVKKFDTDNSVIFYISTFQKDKMDYVKNTLTNHVNRTNISTENNVLALNTSSENVVTQDAGIHINSTIPLTTMFPKDMQFSEEKFTIVWFAKFIPTTYVNAGLTKNVFLINIPITNSQNLIGVEFEFHPEYHNPSIKIHWKGNVFKTEHNYVFKDFRNDDDKNKSFFDNKYHMFTLLKSSDNTIKLILDDHTLASAPLIDASLSAALTNQSTVAANMENNYIITLNANVNTPTPSTKMDNPVNALAIFNKVVSYTEINAIYKHFIDIKYQLDPRYITLQNKLNEYNDYKMCPFSDSTFCKTSNCAAVLDWTDNSSVLKNDNCYKDVVKYCKGLDNYNKDKMCTFFDENNILKSASFVNNSIMPVQGDNNDEEDLVKQLRKMGVNKVFLDKSLRANGKYSDEINQLIDKIYEQKQLNMNGIQDLYDADSEDLSIKDIEYDTLINSKSKSSSPVVTTAEAAEAAAVAAVAAVKIPVDGELMNLKFKDLEYDELISDYEKMKTHNTNEKSKNDDGFITKLASWF